jgi:hypothetical protein
MLLFLKLSNLMNLAYTHSRERIGCDYFENKNNEKSCLKFYDWDH